MDKSEYKKIGFKCGIEIHQQLEGKKLFCNCPTEIRKDKADFSFDRRLRAAAGESGKVDIAATHEQKKAKLFTYQGYEDINCLVEMDEEPPRNVNQDSLKTALQVAKMMNCEIVNKIQFMRKTVVDGSNVSGFQRTAIIGLNGWIDVEGHKVGILGVFLEEEACQVISRTTDHDTYNISRLGIPLLEIATAPDIRDAEECQKAAARIGMILRSTGACKRGIGSIRQDVNLSIKGSARTEIKGFQDLKSIPKVVAYEIKRQQEVIAKGEKVAMEVRRAEPDFTTKFLRPMPGGARMYPETDVPTIIVGDFTFEQVEMLDEKQVRFEKEYKLNSDYAKQAVSYIDKTGTNLEDYFKKYKQIESKYVLDCFTAIPKELKKRYEVTLEFETVADEMLTAILQDKVSKSMTIEVLVEYSKSGKLDFSKFETVSDEELEKEIKRIVDKSPNAPVGALMGQVMAKFKGQVEGKTVMMFLQRNLKK